MAALTGSDQALPLCFLPDYLDETVGRFGERLAVDFLGRTWTWADVGVAAERIAAGFQQLGIAKGDRVGLCLPNSPFSLIAYFGVLKAGGTVVNFNPLYVERELAEQVVDSGVRTMVTLDLHLIFDKVEALRERGLLDRLVVCQMVEALPLLKRALFRLVKGRERVRVPVDEAHIRFADLVATKAPFRPVDVDIHTDIAVLQYTGGTTGTPKGAMLTHANLSANVEQVKAAFPGARPGEERLLAVLPFFHVFAMTVLQNYSVATGAEIVMLPRFELKQLLKTIARTRPTLLPGVPTLYSAINRAPAAKRIDLSSILYCFSGGAPLAEAVKADFEALTGCTLVEGYGLTEAGPVVSVNPLDGVNKIDSIGRPLVGTRVRVRALEAVDDADGESEGPGAGEDRFLDVGEKGEIVVSGPQVMKGYWRQDEESAAALRGGWLHTGDVGYIDEDGYIFLVDRIKDLIVCSGFNVYPRAVEDALYRHPEVAEAVVIGIPDSYRGQAPKAFVRLHAGASATKADLLAHLADQLSRIEMPKAIEIRQTLPKTMVGKLSKKALVEEEARRVAEGEGQPD